MRAVVFWGVVLAALIAAHFMLLGQVLRSIPDAAVFSNQSGLGISVSDVMNADEDHSYSARIAADGILAAQMSPRRTQARFIYANSVHELHMLSGMFPSSPGAVAISEALAVRWFFTTDILGAEILADGRTFNISGVFREVTPMFSGAEQTDTAYLHLSAYPNSEAQITELWASPDGRLPAQILDEAAILLGKRIWPAETVNYHPALLMAKQSRAVLWFFLGMNAAVTLFIVILRRCVKLLRHIRSEAQNYGYAADRKRQIWDAFWCVICLAAAVGTAWLVSFEPYLPVDWASGSDVYSAVIPLYVIAALAPGASVMVVVSIHHMTAHD
jgi:hypothetical protein